MYSKSYMFRMVLRSLIEMNYQVTFSVLQAGNYGCPQTRKRAIIWAGPPQDTMPEFPEATHTFRSDDLRMPVASADGIGTSTWQGVKFNRAGPQPPTTIGDAIADLPPIAPGNEEVQGPRPYAPTAEDELPTFEVNGSMNRFKKGDPVTTFQRKIRTVDPTLPVGQREYVPELRDHETRTLSHTNQVRCALVPMRGGADWRDLQVGDPLQGKKTDAQLDEFIQDSAAEHLPDMEQLLQVSPGKWAHIRSGRVVVDGEDTSEPLAPRCLADSATRFNHNHWRGLFGRVSYSGHFPTIITDPNPMGKVGDVFMPDQHRMVGCREVGRGQGFPDTFRFHGTVQNKFKQIGNAVPVLMSEAIGTELRYALAKNMLKFDAPYQDPNGKYRQEEQTKNKKGKAPKSKQQ